MAIVLTWPVGRGDDGDAGSSVPKAAPVVAYVAGATLGGAASGFGVGLLSTTAARLTSWSTLVVAACAGALAVVAFTQQWRGRLAPLGERRGQVPRRWLHWQHLELTAAAFGLMIGSGVLTRLQHASAYVLLAALLVAPSVQVAALLGAVYGFSRGMTLALTWIGDRFLGTRPPWSRVAGPSTRVNRRLALVSSTLFALALLGLG